MKLARIATNTSNDRESISASPATLRYSDRKLGLL